MRARDWRISAGVSPEKEREGECWRGRGGGRDIQREKEGEKEREGV